MRSAIPKTTLHRADCRLRPVTEADLELLRGWRNSDRVRAVMHSKGLIDAVSQRRWFAGLKGDPTRAYFVFEVAGRPVGSVYYNPIDRAANAATWGFYRGEDAAPGTGYALGFTGLEKAFDDLGFAEIRAETFAANAPGLRLHDGLGFRRECEQTVERGGQPEALVMFSYARADWQKNKEELAARIFAA